MKETKGELLARTVGSLLLTSGAGAAGSLASYGYTTYTGPQEFTFSGAAKHATAGAVYGLMNGPYSATPTSYAISAARSFAGGAGMSYIHQHWPW
jgi:hypothetical protein